MAALRSRFAERCSSDAAILRKAWEERDAIELRQVLHSVAGNAGVFGYTALSASARQIEEALDSGSIDAMIEGELGKLLRDMDVIAFESGT